MNGWPRDMPRGLLFFPLVLLMFVGASLAVLMIHYGGAPNPYDPRDRCNASVTDDDPDGKFVELESVQLDRAAVVHVFWDGQRQENCVVTMKIDDVGTPTMVEAYLLPDDGAAVQDEGMYKFFTLVRAKAPSCIVWGGSANGEKFRSTRSYCNGSP